MFYVDHDGYNAKPYHKEVIRYIIVLLSYMSPNLTPALIARLYKGYVRPSIEYASPLWNNKLTAGNVDTLERLQARMARQYLHRRKCPIPHGMENVFEREGKISVAIICERWLRLSENGQHGKTPKSMAVKKLLIIAPNLQISCRIRRKWII